MNDVKNNLNELRAAAQALTDGRVVSAGSYMNIYSDEPYLCISAEFGSGAEFRICSAHGNTLEEAIEKLNSCAAHRLAELKADEPATVEAIHD